jgi:mannose-6-phosphate isomerase-like protein (cupin superfamily)/glycerol-3-phosphate cytidylyltransferase-like family protein
MFKEARKLGDKLVVILNNDHWLRNKKGFTFMPEKERVELIASFPFVDRVVLTDHKPQDPDRSVARTLKKIQPHVFANGGDRLADNIPEAVVCRELGIRTVFNIGRGGKIQSSSWMIGAASRDVRRSVRPWGEFYGWDEAPKWYLKTLYVKPGKRLSLQHHRHRSEIWTLVEGDAIATTGTDPKHLTRTTLKIGEPFFVPKGMIHRLESKKGGKLVEVALGKFDENDIIRVQDDFGRIDPR